MFLFCSSTQIPDEHTHARTHVRAWLPWSCRCVTHEGHHYRKRKKITVATESVLMFCTETGSAWSTDRRQRSCSPQNAPVEQRGGTQHHGACSHTSSIWADKGHKSASVCQRITTNVGLFSQTTDQKVEMRHVVSEICRGAEVGPRRDPWPHPGYTLKHACCPTHVPHGSEAPPLLN